MLLRLFAKKSRIQLLADQLGLLARFFRQPLD
jgi:hypothetical protein